MAREMNVEKRVEIVRQTVTKVSNCSAKLKKAAEELQNSFKGDKSPKGRKAHQTAQNARKLAAALDKAASTVSA